TASQLVEAPGEATARHEEVRGERVGEPFALGLVPPLGDGGDLGAVPGRQVVRVFMGHRPAAPFGWVADVDSYAAAQYIDVNEEPCHVPGKRQQKHAQAYFDLQY